MRKDRKATWVSVGRILPGRPEGAWEGGAEASPEGIAWWASAPQLPPLWL